MLIHTVCFFCCFLMFWPCQHGSFFWQVVQSDGLALASMESPPLPGSGDFAHDFQAVAVGSTVNMCEYMWISSSFIHSVNMCQYVCQYFCQYSMILRVFSWIHLHPRMSNSWFPGDEKKRPDDLDIFWSPCTPWMLQLTALQKQYPSFPLHNLFPRGQVIQVLSSLSVFEHGTCSQALSLVKNDFF